MVLHNYFDQLIPESIKWHVKPGLGDDKEVYEVSGIHAEQAYPMSFPHRVNGPAVLRKNGKYTWLMSGQVICTTTGVVSAAEQFPKEINREELLFNLIKYPPGYNT